MNGTLIATAAAMAFYAAGLLFVVLFSSVKKVRALKLGAILFVVGYVITAVIFYFLMPTITVPNMLLANLITAGVLLPLLLYAVRPDQKFEARVATPIMFLFGLGLVGLLVTFVLGFTALGTAHETITYQEKDEAEPLSKEETPIAVAPEFARNKTQKAMSVVPNTQFFDLGKLQVQKVNGEVVYVAPVEFAGFWKFLRGQETAGYFTISATDVSGQPQFHESPMKYTNSSYLHHYIQRVIYNEYPHYIQSGEAQIEVDDNGKPWYVQTVYRPLHFTNRPDFDEIKVVVIDPETGKMEMYDTEKAPEFIEGSVSSEIATMENHYFGKYVHGWLNSVFGKKDVKIPNKSGTESEVTPIFNNKGEMLYFTDMTSPKENIDSALGYTLIDARTGELVYYNGEKNNGIMDSEGAKQIVNKEFPEKKWEGSMPVLYNVDGHPTWIVNVLDPNGLLKQYAYIKANDSDFAVFGDTAKETLDAYRMALMQDPGNIGATEETVTEPVEGVVSRVSVTSSEKGQVVYFLLENDTTIYIVNASKFPLSIFLEKGDRIKARAQVLDNETATIEDLTIEGLTGASSAR
ncbi:DNA-binding protein [Anoxybacillus sp. UARK-01]|uniref:DNA-binding protein n=1 Tax=Anoxybacillus sp. UARK-01 TaxID=1895648 RepID=UPI0009BB2EA8|nr:DNA-binding protein [Anoxybacillus sp. UARK-01]OQM44712.1 DNA-binding protein [Anoxybacillus sp. UARK-01]